MITPLTENGGFEPLNLSPKLDKMTPLNNIE